MNAGWNNIRNNRRGGLPNNDKPEQTNKSKFTIRKLYWIGLLIIILFGSGILGSLNIFHDFRNYEQSYNFEVVGYSYDPPAHKRSAHRYLFLRNEIGSFTFEVTPQTYFDAEHGKKNMSFTCTTYELMFKSNNDQTRESVIKHYIEKTGNSEFAARYYNWEVIPIMLSFIWLIAVLIHFIWLISWNDDEIDKEYAKWYEKVIYPIIIFGFIIMWFKIV